MVLCTYQCYARKGVTQGVGIFVKYHSPGTLTAFYPILPFCFKSHSPWATSCFFKNSYHYDQLGGS